MLKDYKSGVYESVKMYNSLPVRIKKRDGFSHFVSEIAEKAK